MKPFLRELKYDLPAGIVVFLVAVPLCLGIALASEAPLISGIIAGIAGGIVVGIVSGSPLGVSGPAAGLTVIVAGAIASLGNSWETFLTAVVVAGVIQVILGLLRLGTIANYFPGSVITGMLTGIGLLIIFKQIPHAFGYDADYEGDESFFQKDHENTFSELLNMWSGVTPGAIIIFVVSVAIILLWEQPFIRKNKILQYLPGPLVAIITGIVLHYLYLQNLLPFYLNEEQLVIIPESSSLSDFVARISTPDFSQLNNADVYKVAIIIAVVASLETLLCVEATDKLDPQKRKTPPNRELMAQGAGNIVSGLLGGLPVTQVIVRSSANITFGGRTKMSTILHGLFILICVINIPHILNMIPYATLAAILIMVGFKLARPVVFANMYKAGVEQFLPFIVTLGVMLFSDLLIGISAGIVTALLFLLYHKLRGEKPTIETSADNEQYLIRLSGTITFLHKAKIKRILSAAESKRQVVIQGNGTGKIHPDITEIIADFRKQAASRAEIKISGIQFNNDKKNKH